MNKLQSLAKYKGYILFVKSRYFIQSVKIFVYSLVVKFTY